MVKKSPSCSFSRTGKPPFAPGILAALRLTFFEGGAFEGAAGGIDGISVVGSGGGATCGGTGGGGGAVACVSAITVAEPWALFFGWAGEAFFAISVCFWPKFRTSLTPANMNRRLYSCT